MIPPSTKRAKRRADLARGRGRDCVRVDVDARVTGEGACRLERGVGRNDREDDLGTCRDSAAAVPASVNAAARARDASLRPSDAQSTSCPAATSAFPIAAPISPGWRSPTITLAEE